VTPQALPPRGWYADPADGSRERYWDGAQWTQRVRRRVEVVPTQRERERVLTIEPVYPPPAGQALAPATAATVRLASWGRRAAAAIVDLVIEVILLGFGIALFARGFAERWSAASQGWFREALAAYTAGEALPALPQSLTQQQSTVALVLGIFTAAYAVVFVGLLAATPGQLLLGLRIIPAPKLTDLAQLQSKAVTAEEGRAKVRWLAAAARGLAWAILTSTQYLFIIQVINAFLPIGHPRRQSLCDLVARTLVVRRHPG